MSEFGLKNTKYKIMTSPVFAIVIILILFFLARGTINTISNEKMASIELQRKERELASVIEANKIIDERINYLSTERGMEEVLRRDWKAVLPGEEVAIIIDQKDEQTPSSENASSSWSKFWGTVLFWK